MDHIYFLMYISGLPVHDLLLHIIQKKTNVSLFVVFNNLHHLWNDFPVSFINQLWFDQCPVTKKQVSPHILTSKISHYKRKMGCEHFAFMHLADTTSAMLYYLCYKDVLCLHLPLVEYQQF